MTPVIEIDDERTMGHLDEGVQVSEEPFRRCRSRVVAGLSLVRPDV